MWGVLGEFGPVTPSPGNKALTMMWLLGVYEPPPRKHLAQHLAQFIDTVLTNPRGSLNQPTWAHWEVLPPCGDAENCVKVATGGFNSQLTIGQRSGGRKRHIPPIPAGVCCILPGHAGSLGLEGPQRRLPSQP